ncbi:MAG: T9SS type A sorting domain-containing protein, partial [Ferruginibacter sp.]
TTSEWQWYKWSNESIWINGRYYCWLEYFIKRLGDEYKETGIKLVDVVDIHNYPWYNNNNNEALQLHRIYYDTLYDYPGSNGIFTSTGGWNTSLTKQYLFKRFNDWLNEHFGANHGITAGVSEWSPGPSEPNLASVIYGSHLGTFANNGVELFSPWTWFTGMWETLHLFSRNAKEYSVSSTSSDENMVSAYSSINANADSLTVMLINRDMTASRTVTINLSNFNVANGNYQTLLLSSLPATETFVSHTQNALTQNTVAVNSNSLTITVPALSTTAILLNAPTGTLPIRLLNFSGKENSSGNRILNWDLAFESNMSKYIIERSFDGKNFIDINAVTAKNSSAGKSSYSYTDSSYVDPTIKQLFYRLKMVGINEAGQRSKTVLINLKSHEVKIKIYPQPGSSAGITIEFVNSAGRSKDLVLTDALGNKIRSWRNYMAGQLFLSGLKAGVYLIKEVNKNSGNKTINKFIIQ